MDWTALGQALRAAREGAGLRQVDVATRLDVGESTVQSIERGQQFTKPTRTIRAYAAELGWPSGAVERVLAGGEPNAEEPERGPESAPAEQSAAMAEGGLPLRIVADLTDDGALLDTAVIPLPGGGQAVVVVKGKVGASPQEIREALEAWKYTQARLLESRVGDVPPTESGV